MSALAHIDTDDLTASWTRIQSAAMTLARVRRHPHLAPLGAEAFGAWVSQQRQDLDAGARDIEDLLTGAGSSGSTPAAEAVRKTVSDLTRRTEQIERTHAVARGLVRKHETGLSSLKASSDLRASGDAEGLSALATTIEALVQEIEAGLTDLVPSLDPEKIARSLKSAEAGERPIRQVLQGCIERLKTAGPAGQDVPKAPPAPPMPRSSSPVPTPGPAGPAPIDAQMRKRLGRSFSAMEIEHVSLQFFTMLWENDVDPGRCGDILFHVPANCGGMNVHDLLGYAKGPELLRSSLREFQTRFAGDRS